MPDILEETAIIWNKTLNNIKSQVSEQVFNAWFHPIKPISGDENSIGLGVPNDFFKEWVSEKYLNLILASLNAASGREISVVFTVMPQKAEEAEAKPKDGPQKDKPRNILQAIFPKHPGDAAVRQIGVNPKYNFDNFVVGSGNRFAHAASRAIGESPAKTYNPLFIYGGVGLGKTHLMHAIGNYILQKNQKAKILYISSEEFTNQLIHGIQTKTTPDFRKRYRGLDVLLIDDIHFIAGKESTQEEFFHTFNALYDANKQIVMSSDRSPKEIPTLEERLVSRFGWGLVTDIQAPDFETRIAILKKKSEAETTPIPDSVFYFLAENIKTNIRELEGALIRVIAYAKLTGENTSCDLAKEVLRGMIKEGGKKINIDLIQRRVAEYFNIRFQDMKTKKRTQTIAYPRQIAMFLSRDLTNLSLPEIGGYFGGRDHTTVLHACNKLEKDMASKEDIKQLIEKLSADIKR